MKAKKWGHLRIIFLTSGYYYPEVGNIFANISAKTKYFGVLHRGLGTIDSCKKPDIKNLMLVSL